MEFSSIIGIKFPKVNQFTCSVYFSLESSFTLIEHRGCINFHPPFASELLSTSFKNLSSFIHSELNPTLLSINCGLASIFYFFFACNMYICNDMSMIMWYYLFYSISSVNFFSINNARNLDNFFHLPIHLFE